MATQANLLITADDFGIGLETSRGILDLADAGLLTSTVLLVNSPYAEASVNLWHSRGANIELGWHPCLTLDRPILPPGEVPTLVEADGSFQPLGTLLKKLVLGKINTNEVTAEFRAQLDRYIELVGTVPTNVNAHHHVHIFRPIGNALAKVLHEVNALSFVRRVVEPWRTLRRVPGAKVKRAALSFFGARAAKRQELAGFPGAEAVLGITDPPFVHDSAFFTRWLQESPESPFLELTCHPGYLDASIEGRDGSFADGQLHRRQKELDLLNSPTMREALRPFTLIPAAPRRRAPVRLFRAS